MKKWRYISIFLFAMMLITGCSHSEANHQPSHQEKMDESESKEQKEFSSANNKSDLKEKPALAKQNEVESKQTIPQNVTIKKEEKNKPNNINQATEFTQLIMLDHMKISVNKDWTITQGLDSVSFNLKNEPIGGIDGLAYSDNMTSLLPNHSKVVKSSPLNGLNFKANQVVTESDSLNGKKEQETHILLFIEPKVQVYDLHIRSKDVDESTLLKIAKSATH
jgi:hypothetical protein